MCKSGFFLLNGNTENVKSRFTGRFLSVNSRNSDEVDDSESRDESRSAIVDISNENIIPPFIRRAFENPFDDSDIEFINRKDDEIQPDFPYARDAVSNQEKKQFYYQPTESNTMDVCTADLKTVGKHCLVYYYDNVNDRKYGEKFIDPTDEEFQKLADFFDGVYERETNLLGGTAITDNHSGLYITATGEEKILIFVYDLFGDAEKDSNGGTYGFFMPRDLYASGRQFSLNEAEMFYVDSDFLKKFPDSIYSTLVHEFNHLLNYVNKIINSDRSNTDMVNAWNRNPWFTEMLAMNAEDVLIEKDEKGEKDVINARIPLFMCHYSKGFYNWNFENDQSLEEQLMIYGNTYAFGAYLIRNYGGIRLLHEMATNGLYGKGSVTQALHDCGYENENFDSVFMKFPLVIANVDKNDDGFISLNRDVPLTKIGDFSYSVSAINLYNYNYRTSNSTIAKGPWFATKGNSYDIDAWGFVVYRLDRSVKYELPQNNAIGAYYYSQGRNEVANFSE